MNCNTSNIFVFVPIRLVATSLAPPPGKCDENFKLMARVRIFALSHKTGLELEKKKGTYLQPTQRKITATLVEVLQWMIQHSGDELLEAGVYILYRDLQIFSSALRPNLISDCSCLRSSESLWYA